MDRRSTIYTKKGDTGNTQLCDGKDIFKNSVHIKACGNLDELTAYLGLARTYIIKNKRFDNLANNLHRIQLELIQINSAIALACSKEKITMEAVQKLEQEIDIMDATLAPLSSFIVIADSEIAAQLNVARAICRRAERNMVALIKNGNNFDAALLAYLNRLSDWLFVAARFTEKNI